MIDKKNNNRKQKIIFALAFSIIAFFLYYSSVWKGIVLRYAGEINSGNDYSESQVDIAENQAGETLEVKLYDEKNFYDSLLWLKNNPIIFPDCRIVSSVVPHHLLAGFMPARLFSDLESKGVGTIILIGPNHWEKGGKILTSDAIWKTAFGNIYPDMEIITELNQKGLVRIENEIMQGEHSTTGLFPLMEYYLPNAKIVPIILSAKNSQAEIEKLSMALEKYLKDEKNVLVASVDFSHYLNQMDAEKKDEETLELIQKLDYQNLYGLNNDYLDSPSAMAMFILATKRNGDGEVKIIEHANSADILGGNITSTTSYYSLFSCRKNDKGNDKTP